MLSYLVNRHYHLLTKEVPEEMRVDQPKVVYLPSHTCEKVTYLEPTKKKESRLRMRKSKQIVESNPNIGDWYLLIDLVVPFASLPTTFPSSSTGNNMSVSSAAN